MKRRRLFALVAVLALLAGAAGVRLATSGGRTGAVRLVAGTTTTPGLRSAFLEVGRTRRHYLLYVPPSTSAGTRHPAPLVVAFHGLHLSAAWMARSTGLVGAARRAGIALALPDAVNGAWNDGRLGPHGPDDLRFATTLVDALVRSGVADPRRVTVSGYSNGAELALVLAALHPPMFAAVVSVSGALPALPASPRPHDPVPAWFTHGTVDPIQPWGGRPTRNRLHPALLSEDGTVEAFVRADRSGSAQQVPTGGHSVEQTVWPAGAGGAPVTLYRLLGAGHGWPTVAGTCGATLCGGRLDAAALVVSVATHA